MSKFPLEPYHSPLKVTTFPPLLPFRSRSPVTLPHYPWLISFYLAHREWCLQLLSFRNIKVTALHFALNRGYQILRNQAHLSLWQSRFLPRPFSNYRSSLLRDQIIFLPRYDGYGFVPGSDMVPCYALSHSQPTEARHTTLRTTTPTCQISWRRPPLGRILHCFSMRCQHLRSGAVSDGGMTVPATLNRQTQHCASLHVALNCPHGTAQRAMKHAATATDGEVRSILGLHGKCVKPLLDLSDGGRRSPFGLLTLWT